MYQEQKKVFNFANRLKQSLFLPTKKKFKSDKNNGHLCVKLNSIFLLLFCKYGIVYIFSHYAITIALHGIMSLNMIFLFYLFSGNCVAHKTLTSFFKMTISLFYAVCLFFYVSFHSKIS